MAFSIVCNNRGCGDLMDPYIDPATNQVFCSKCNKELNNVTTFIKSQMKQNKQFKPKTQTSFAVKCKNCNHESRPTLKNKDIICPNCNKPHSHLSEPFKLMLLDNLKKINQDI